MLAIYFSLRNKVVDIITSSKVLAIRDSKDLNELFSYFKISSTNNCDVEAESSEKKRYKRYTG